MVKIQTQLLFGFRWRRFMTLPRSDRQRGPPPIEAGKRDSPLAKGGFGAGWRLPCCRAIKTLLYPLFVRGDGDFAADPRNNSRTNSRFQIPGVLTTKTMLESRIDGIWNRCFTTRWRRYHRPGVRALRG